MARNIVVYNPDQRFKPVEITMESQHDTIRYFIYKCPDCGDYIATEHYSGAKFAQHEDCTIIQQVAIQKIDTKGSKAFWKVINKSVELYGEANK